jgi:hypothetical protein
MRRLGIALLSALMLAIVMAPALYYWDSNKNRGFTWGYYGDFNVISNVLASMPHVYITNTYCHTDVSLELFSFDLLVHGKPMHLRFPQADPIRALRGIPMTNALATLLKTQSEAETNGQ